MRWQIGYTMSDKNTLFRLEDKNETKIISAYSPVVIRYEIIQNQPLSNEWLVHLFHNRLDIIPFKSMTTRDFMAIYEPWIPEESIPEPSYE